METLACHAPTLNISSLVMLASFSNVDTLMYLLGTILTMSCSNVDMLACHALILNISSLVMPASFSNVDTLGGHA